MSIHFLYNYGLVDLEDLDTDDIDTVSVAKALSRLPRWCGNFDSMSVAQHAYLVAELVEKMGGTPAQQMAALHHDDTECFVGDIPQMVKRQCDDYQDIEETVAMVLEEKYGIDLDDPMVHNADNIVGARELNYHLDMNPHIPRVHMSLPANYLMFRMTHGTLASWGADVALARYLEKHDELMIAMAEWMEDHALEAVDQESDKCLS